MTHNSLSIESLFKRGSDFLGTRYAILGGAMTWVSNHQLVAAISNSGGFGVLASGAMPPNILSEEIDKTKLLTKKPFGVNLITMHPRLDEMIDVCGQHKISHVVLAGGLPNTSSFSRIKTHGCSVIGFAPALAIAKKLIKMGTDAIIIEGSEAGGHIGPVSTSVLAQEILPEIREVPVFVAGGIGRGEAIVSYLQMGASGCQLGTRFVCAEESPAHENFKQAFIRAQARDAVVSLQLDQRFPVIPVRALTNKATKDFLEVQARVIKEYDNGATDLKEAQLKIEHYWAGALKRAAIDGDIENGSLMAGQSVGMVTKIQPTTEIMNDLIMQANTFLKTSSNKAASSSFPPS
ncbi:MAG: NAD(P)H-dependent flavin oxidoreductase [Pseudomonadota bacterium]|jgi:enoyl-[acyl-carrier protein] reductase II|nr:nitronate monooxygenase [Alphaproteobacteria bacterium]